MQTEYLCFKIDFVGGSLVSRLVNLSGYHQCTIQEPIKTNTQTQLQFSASHYTLVSPIQTSHQLSDTYLQRYLFSVLFSPNYRGCCPLVPIFNKSNLGFSHSNNTSRYFDQKVKPPRRATPNKD